MRFEIGNDDIRKSAMLMFALNTLFGFVSDFRRPTDNADVLAPCGFLPRVEREPLRRHLDSARGGCVGCGRQRDRYCGLHGDVKSQDTIKLLF